MVQSVDKFLRLPIRRLPIFLISLVDRAWLASCSAPNTRMIRELRCEDVFKGCSYVEVGSDIRELMAHFMAHVRDVHRITSPTPELRIQAMVAVRERQAQVD